MNHFDLFDSVSNRTLVQRYEQFNLRGELKFTSQLFSVDQPELDLSKEIETMASVQIKPEKVPQLINAAELAKMLGVSNRTIWRLIAKGRLVQPLRIGRNVRWRLDEVISWINQGCPISKQ